MSQIRWEIREFESKLENLAVEMGTADQGFTGVRDSAELEVGAFRFTCLGPV